MQIINFLSTQSDAHGQFIIAQLLSHVAMQAVTYNLSGVKDKRGEMIIFMMSVMLMKSRVDCDEFPIPAAVCKPSPRDGQVQ